MRQNKKIVSLAVVFAMIMTMLSSMVVVNAAAGEVYTKVEETDSKITLTIGYKDFTDVDMVGNTQVKVKIPEGFTAGTINLTETFKAATTGVADGVLAIAYAASADYSVGSEGVIATVDLTKDADVADGTYTFEITDFAFTKADFSTVDFASGVTKSEGTYKVGSDKPVIPPEPETAHVYVYGDEVKDGKVTITIGYKGFTDVDMVGNTQVKVKVPDIFTVGTINLTETFKAATTGVADGVLAIAYAASADYSVGSEGVIATVELTLNDDATVPSTGVNLEIIDFAFTKADFSTIDLTNGVETYVTPITVAGGSEPTPTPTPTPTPDAGDNKIKSVTLDATAKAAKAGDKVTFNVTVDGTGDKSVKATAKLGDADVAVDVKGSVVTVTVPSDAVEDDKIELVVTSAVDSTKFAKATITVIDPVIDIKPVEKTEVTMNGEKVKMFVPNITAVADKDITAKFTADKTYRVVFDFTKKDGTTVGKAVTSISGAQVALLADNDATNDPEIFADALGAEVATIHFEDSKGNVIQ